MGADVREVDQRHVGCRNASSVATSLKDWVEALCGPVFEYSIEDESNVAHASESKGLGEEVSFERTADDLTSASHWQL